MLRETLGATIEAVVATLVREGKLPAAVAEVPIEISDTKAPEHGDYACNLAMAAAKKAGMNPRALGELLRDGLIEADSSIENRQSEIETVEVAGPGFLNLRVRPEAIAAYVPEILKRGTAFGLVANANPQRINVEFVSVNPNGPITIGSGRGAAFGSTLCNVLQAAGNVVHREYYINDGVNSEQMRLFAESVRSYLLGFVYGEWVGEDLTEEGEAVPLDLLNDWAGTLPDIDASPQDLYADYQSFAEGHDSLSARHAGENDRAQNASEYRRDRPQQLFSLVQEGRLPLSASLPENGYRGVYVRDVAKEIVNAGFAEASELAKGPLADLQDVAQALMIERQRGDLEAFGVFFDTWFSEQSLHDRGVVAEKIEGLKANGVADEAPYRTKLKMGKGGKVEETIREDQPNEDEGEEETANNPQPTTHNQSTLWLRSTLFGDDMDRVLRRRDGRLTYIASDVSYHEDKLNRPEGATKMITILGPDHHGYIGRLTAVVAALLRGPEGTPEANALALATAKEKLEVVIYQLVRFLKDGKPAPMRKRDGNIYELRDLIDELGKSLNPDGTEEERRTTGRDVARFFYLMRSHDTTMDFDIDLATQQSDENPVFYAQYAHARICSVLRKASDTPPSGEGQGWGSEGQTDYALLTHPRELALVKKILDLPWEVERIAKDYGVHRLATYAVELARSYHHFYDACRVIQPERPDLTAARLALCEATKIALRATFDLLGVSAPERLERRAEISV